MPLYAEVKLPWFNFEVFFDKPLLPGPSLGFNWHFRYHEQARVGNVVNAVGSWIVGTSLFDGLAPPASLLDYLGMPLDVFGENLLPVAAFDSLPII